MLDESPTVAGAVEPSSSEPLGRSSIDDIIAMYMKDVDRTMLRETLRMTVTERLQWAARAGAQAVELYEAGRRHRGEA